MFREKEEATNMTHSMNDNTTILKEDACFEGKLIFEGNVLVNGKFNGEIYSKGELTIGTTGFVEGKVEIGTIIVHGEVRGNISATQKIVINAPAVVRGDITAPSLIIEEGALFEGNCSMGKEVAEATHEHIEETEEQHDHDSNVVGMHASGGESMEFEL